MKTRNMRILLVSNRAANRVMRTVEPVSMVPATIAREVLFIAGGEVERRARGALRSAYRFGVVWALLIAVPYVAGAMLGVLDEAPWRWLSGGWAFVVGVPVLVMAHRLIVGLHLNRAAVALAGRDPDGTEPSQDGVSIPRRVDA